MREEISISDNEGTTRSSGNVFADLGLPGPEERLTKAELARLIRHAIQRRGLTQSQAAEALGLDQPKVSAITRGVVSGFSTDRLIRFLSALGHDVEIMVREKPVQAGTGTVSVTSVPLEEQVEQSNTPNLAFTATT